VRMVGEGLLYKRTTAEIESAVFRKREGDALKRGHRKKRGRTKVPLIRLGGEKKGK